MRVWLAVLVLLPAMLAIAGPVAAAEPNVLTELQRARELVAETRTAYGEGRPDAAMDAIRSAYLDHFELVEIPLRVRDEGLTLRVEQAFAAVRGGIQAAVPADRLRLSIIELEAGLDDAERVLSGPGLAAPLIAAVYSFTILFREGIEIVLVVAFILSSLAATREQRHRRTVLQGVAAGLAASVAVFALVSVVLDVAPVQREVMEAVMTLVAIALLFYISFWLIARLNQRNWLEFARSNVSVAASSGSAFALFAVGFTSVFREGVETALFYQALMSFARGLDEWVAAGAAVAGATLIGVAWLVFGAGRRIPVKQVLGVAVAMLMILSVAMVGNAVRSLQQLGVVPLTILDAVPSLPLFLSELLGWHPTLETIVGQAVLGVIYLVGALWALRVVPRRLAEARAMGVRRPAD